jgi:hypothetical protein
MTPEIHSSSVSTEHGHPPPPLPQPCHLTCNIDQCGRRGFEELVDCIYQKGPTLVSLSLHRDGHCRSLQDVQRLLDTLAGVVAPRLATVAFYDFNSREEMELVSTYFSSLAFSSSVSASLSLRKVTISSDHVPTSLFKALGALPHLEELHIRSSRWGHVAVDDILPLLLHHHPSSLSFSSSSSSSSLKCLVLDAYGTGPRKAHEWCIALAHALSVNTVLQRLELHFLTGGKPGVEAKQILLQSIQQSNFSLWELNVHGWDMNVEFCPIYRQIQYYLDFNGRGRGRLSSSSTKTMAEVTPTDSRIKMMTTTTTTLRSSGIDHKPHQPTVPPPLSCHSHRRLFSPVQSHEDWVQLLLTNSPCEFHLDWDVHWHYYVLQKNPTLCQF